MSNAPRPRRRRAPAPIPDGLSTVGDREALDVRAVAAFAREHGHPRVVTVGASMGAISVLREAATYADVDAVVSVSSPGRWSGHSRVARLLFDRAAGPKKLLVLPGFGHAELGYTPEFAAMLGHEIFAMLFDSEWGSGRPGERLAYS